MSPLIFCTIFTISLAFSLLCRAFVTLNRKVVGYVDIQYVALLIAAELCEWSLTWDQGPVLQTGGHVCVLQVCLRDSGGCAHWSSVTVSTWSGPVFWRQRTCLICSPDPQLRLHTPQSSTLQLWYTTAHTRHFYKFFTSRKSSLSIQRITNSYHMCWVQPKLSQSIPFPLRQRQ